MRALLYGEGTDAATEDREGTDALLAHVRSQPVRLAELPDPVAGEHHAVLAPRLAGVCGSDARLLLGRFSDGDLDNPMAAFSPLPFVLGHEVVADVVAAPSTGQVREGDRVVVDPWLSCAPRGLAPCAACRRGDLSLCEGFLEGPVGPGLHLGVAPQAHGAFATLLGAHRSQLHAVPEGVTDEQAVLADPVAVSLHAIGRVPPPPGARALVIGVGALGTTTLALLRRLHPEVETAAVHRYDHQAELALRLGATASFAHDPATGVLESVAAWCGATLRPALAGLPMAYPGGVDVVYDTVGTAETLELSVRALRMRGSLALVGVATPQRFEWTPLYFKELSVVGSSGFGVEPVGGRRRHAIDHYLEWCSDGLDLSSLVTHTEPLERWAELCAAIAAPERSGVVKAAFDLRA